MMKRFSHSSESNPLAASVRLNARSMQKAHGQRRHDLRTGRLPAYVDVTRSHLNRVLIQPRPLPRIRDEIKLLRTKRGAKRNLKSNATVVSAGIITFGNGAADLFKQLTIKIQNAAFIELANGLAERLDTNLESLVVHLDETQIHAHFELRAYDNAGCPISQTMNPTVLSDLQDITATIMQRFCPKIERGKTKKDRLIAGANYPEVLHRSVKQLHRDIPVEIEKKEQVLRDMESRIANLTESEEHKQMRIAKLDRREFLNQKWEELLAIEARKIQDKQTYLKQVQANLKTKVEKLEIIFRNLKNREDKFIVKENELEEREKFFREREVRATVEIQKAVAAKDSYELGIRAQESVLTELMGGTIYHDHGRFLLKNPAPLDAAPKTIRKQLLNLLSQHLGVQSSQIKVLQSLGSLRDRMSHWLQRDDLPHAARDAASEIKRDFEDNRKGLCILFRPHQHLVGHG